MIELLLNYATIIGGLMTILGIIVGAISDVVVRKLIEIIMEKNKTRYVEKVIIRHKIVLKDDNKKLYTFEKNGDIINKILLDFEKKEIIHSIKIDQDLSKFEVGIKKENLDLEKVKVANDAESLVFNFVINSRSLPSPKGTKRNISSANMAKDIDLMMKLLQKKVKSNTFTYFALIFSLLVEFLIGALNPLFFNNRIILLTCILIVLSFINQLILKYRVKKGLYGTSYLEAREIITFIFNEQNNGGNGRGKTKLVFPEEEIEQNVLLNRVRGEEHAQ